MLKKDKKKELSYAIHNLDPIFDNQSRILLLGSMPSVKSREQKFYYANPQNRFWKVLYKVFEEEYQEEKEAKISFVQKHHIALWDVIAKCQIEKSKDDSIQDVSYNDLSIILNKAPIRAIFATGKKAYELLLKENIAGIPIHCLPSSDVSVRTFIV